MKATVDARPMEGLYDYPPLRGTPEWDAREDRRHAAGCGQFSYGDLVRSMLTNGASSNPWKELDDGTEVKRW
jgi:hypothetical protein